MIKFKLNLQDSIDFFFFFSIIKMLLTEKKNL